MLGNAKEFDRMYKAGEISKERFEQAQREVEKIKDNYLQISYFMLELQKPFKKRERKEWERTNKILYDCPIERRVKKTKSYEGKSIQKSVDEFWRAKLTFSSCSDYFYHPKFLYI